MGCVHGFGVHDWSIVQASPPAAVQAASLSCWQLPSWKQHAPVGIASVDSVATGPSAVSTLSALRALTAKLYAVAGCMLSTVMVPQMLSVCQTAADTGCPAALTYLPFQAASVVAVHWIANCVLAGFPPAITSSTMLVCVGLLSVGAAGTLASVTLLAVVLYAVSMLF